MSFMINQYARSFAKRLASAIGIGTGANLIGLDTLSSPKAGTVAAWISGKDVDVVAAGADPTGVVDATAIVQAILNAGRNVLVPANATILIGRIEYKVSGQKISGAHKYTSVLKIKAGTTLGICTYKYGVRLDSESLDPDKNPFDKNNLFLCHITVDATQMPNTDGTAAIAWEDMYESVIEDVRVIDPLDDTAFRWGLRLGRAVYTTTISRCIIGAVDLAGSPNGAPSTNIGTTLNIVNNCSFWKLRGRHYQGAFVSGLVIQKDAVAKFDVLGCGGWAVVGGDFEGSGLFLKNEGGCDNWYTAGNAFGGFRGTFFGGAAGRGGASHYMDEDRQYGPRPLTLISQSGSTTVTATVSNSLAPSGRFYADAPVVGQYIIITDCAYAGFNGEWRVLTSNPITNVFTFKIATSGTNSNSSGKVIPDNSRNYRYASIFAGGLIHDPVSMRTIAQQRLILSNTVKLMGFAADNFTEVPIVGIDSLGRLAFGDGTTLSLVTQNGHLYNTLAGKGITLTSAGGTVRTVTLNDAGTGLIFTA